MVLNKEKKNMILNKPTDVETHYSFYYMWMNKIIPYFISLYRYATIFSKDIIFPIEIIRYILCLFLKIEQQLLDSNFRCKCFEKTCIIDWWKTIRIDMPLNDHSLLHCSQKECHVITDCFNRCHLCLGIVCHECNCSPSSGSKNYFYINSSLSQYYICIYCQRKLEESKKINYIENSINNDDYRKCVNCFLVKRYETSNLCDYCDIKLCAECDNFCSHCASHYCDYCIKHYKKGKFYFKCSALYCDQVFCSDCAFYCKHKDCIDILKDKDSKKYCRFCHKRRFHCD